MNKKIRTQIALSDAILDAVREHVANILYEESNLNISYKDIVSLLLEQIDELSHNLSENDKDVMAKIAYLEDKEE